MRHTHDNRHLPGVVTTFKGLLSSDWGERQACVLVNLPHRLCTLRNSFYTLLRAVTIFLLGSIVPRGSWRLTFGGREAKSVRTRAAPFHARTISADSRSVYVDMRCPYISCVVCTKTVAWLGCWCCRRRWSRWVADCLRLVSFVPTRWTSTCVLVCTDPSKQQ